MCSATDDPSRHDLDIQPSDLGVNNAAEALEMVFAPVTTMGGSPHPRPADFWQARVGDLELLGYAIVPTAVNLTASELAGVHDAVILALSVAKP